MTACVTIVRAGKRIYRVPGTLPSDSPTVAERQAAADAAVAELVAVHGAGYSYTDLEPDWTTATAQAVEWVTAKNV